MEHRCTLLPKNNMISVIIGTTFAIIALIVTIIISLEERAQERKKTHIQ